MLAAAACLVAGWPATAHADPRCGPGPATRAVVGSPAAELAWRAVLLRPTRALQALAGRPRGHKVGPREASALLILRARRDDRGRCWLKVRLPWRPNAAAGWIAARSVLLRRTAWRIDVSRRARTVTVRHAGRRVRRLRIVVGAPSTPTPSGLLSIVGVWRWSPRDFLGAWILPLTAHSPVLQEFGGGDGRVGIHGRGGASLLDPLGSARSHGCIRMSNDGIDSIMNAVGRTRLPGIPVWVR